MKKESKPLLIKKRYWILFISVFSLLLIAGGYFYYNYSANQIRNDGMQDLTAIAQLKINQIAQWYNERDGDAKVISSETFFMDGIEKWIQNTKNEALTSLILTKLSQTQKAYGYEAIILSSVNGEVLLSVGSNLARLDKETSAKIIEAVKNREIVHTDFYYCNTEQKIHYDIVAPLIDDENKVVAVIVLRVDPSYYLYPLIQSWPTPSKTAETLLIRKEGNKVLFLNDLRFRDDIALKLEIPLTEKDVPSVQAVLGYKGIWEGIDYRGNKVLSYVNNIPGTNWFMVSKIDNDEIFSELKLRAGAIIIFIVLLISLLIASLTLIYHFRQRNIYRKLYTAQERFKATLYSIGDAIITTDSNGKVQHLNLVAERMTGWSEAEAKGKKLEDVFKIINEETRNKVENPVKKVFAEGIVIGLANHTLLISKDGKEIPISDSGAPIKDETGKIVGVVLVFRDQSEERKNQKLIIDSETKYRRLFESAKDGIIILDAETGKILDVNPFLVGMLGYSHKSFLEKTIWEIGLFNHTDDSHNNFLKIQQKEYVRYDDLTLETVDGQIINVEFVSNAYLVDNKKIIQCSIRDITQRKHAEETLRVSEEKFKNVFEHSVVGKSLTGMDGSLRTNESYSKILGYSEVELSNIKWQQITYPEDIENDKKMINSLISGEKESARWEKRYIHKSGKIIWVDIGSVLQRDKTGKPLYFNTAIYDITERKKAEEALLYSQNLIQGIIDNSPSLIYLLDLDGKFILINKILEKVLALPKEKILGNTRQVFMPEEIAKQHRKNDLTVITSKLSYTFEEENVESDEKHFYLTQKFPLFDSDGKVFAIGGISTDITERKIAEETLRESERKLREAQEMAHLGFWSWDIKTGEVEWSEEVFKIFSLYPKSFTPQIDSILALSPWPEDHQRDKELINRAIETHSTGYYEQKFLRPDQSIGHYYSTFKGVYDEKGGLISIVGTVIDITERKRAENAVRESEKFLKETQKIAQLGSYSLDVNTGFWKSSEILDSVFGIEPDFDKSVQGWTSIIHPEWQQLMAEYFANEVVGLKKPFDKEYKIIRMNDKAERWVHGLGELVFDIENHPVKMIGTIRDITERKNTEQEILRLNRVYALLSNTNQAIVRIKDKQKLFDEICRIAIEDGKFRMAWIGMINHSTDKVDVISSAGLIENYLENINIDLGDETRYYGPTGKAIKNGTHFFSNDIENDNNLQPWKESALKLGYKSSAAFPLKVFGDVIGAFSIYANQKDFFHEHEIKLLVEMVMDISFALEFIETEKNRKVVEENLRISEERFRSLYENSTIGLYRTTPGGKILLANPTLIEMLGYSSFEELATRDLEKDGFESTSERKDFSDAIEITGEVKGFESAWTRRDGTIIYVLESAKSIRDSKGQTLYYDGTVEDITEKRKAEAALRESELRFKQVSESAHEWIWEVDNNGLYTYVSPVIEELLGYKAEEIIGTKYFYDFFEPQNREEMKQAALAAFARKERFKDFINVNIHNDGRKIILSTTGFPVLNDENCLIGYRGVDVDITERKQAEDELLASKLFIEEIINSMPVSVFWKDKNLVYLGCNNLFAHDAGLSDPKEIIGKDDYQMSWRHQAELYRNDDRNVIESGEPKILFEESQTTPEGKTITLLTSKIPLQNSGGEIVGILGTYLDITDRKIAESELIASKEKAEEMNRLKSNFLANMSHELRTPLVGILGYADILRQDVELPEIKTMAETIYKSGTRLSETLNLILDLSKFETEKMNIRYQKVDIVTRAKEIINLFNEIAQKKGLSLISSFSEDPIIIDFEERAFHSILNNLINNAIKFTIEGSVTTTISLDNDFVEIKVIDTGIGIAEQDYQNIFEEFHQVSEGYDRNFEGSGLGLSITKKLVEKFGGTIKVESEIGKGTTFTVILPVTNTEENRKEPTEKEIKITPISSKQKSVKPIALLVDDDPFVFTVLRRYANAYIELETTVDAEFAIKMLKKKQYDLIFMDINLRRGMDGKDATKKIRTMKGYESIPIIATTAYAMEGDKEEFLAAGCTHYLSKPFCKAEIAELLEKLLKLV